MFRMYTYSARHEIPKRKVCGKIIDVLPILDTLEVKYNIVDKENPTTDRKYIKRTTDDNEF